MPFSCQAKIEPGQLRQPPLIFDRWIEGVWGCYVPRGTAFAATFDDYGKCFIKLNCPGFLSTKPTIQPGDEIRDGTVIAYFNADGEDIPYGEPYCIVEYN